MKIESFKGEGIYYHRPYGIAMRKMGPFVFVQGLIATDPRTGKLIKDLDDLPEEVKQKLSAGDIHSDAVEGPIKAQTWMCLHIMTELLESVGSSLDNILQMLVFIRDTRKNWEAFNKVRMMMLKNPPPNTLAETSCLGRSDDVLIEMHVIAGVPDKE